MGGARRGRSPHWEGPSWEGQLTLAPEGQRARKHEKEMANALGP